MATYLPNVTDTFAEIDYAAPNYQLMMQALGTAQSRYNDGFAKVKSVYNSLLNSPLSSSDNMQVREEWFKKSQEQLKKLSRVDLSLAQNVSGATSMFDPLAEDPDFIADMGKTRQYQQELATVQSYKNSSDEKLRKLYNPIIEEDIMLGMGELRSGKRGDGSITSHSVRKFMPVEDVNEFLSKRASEQKLEIKNDSINGPYIVSTTNGSQAVPSYATWAAAQLQGGNFDEFYKRRARVVTEKNVLAIMQQNPSLNKEQALREYGKGILPQQFQSNAEYIREVRKDISSLDNEFRNIKNQYGGKVPEEIADRLMQMNEKRKQLKETLTGAQRDPSMVAPGSEQALENFVRNPYGIQAQMLRNQDATVWATNKAMTQQETSLKVNDWYVAQWKNTQEWAMMRARFAQEEKMQAIKAKNDRDLELAKATGFGELTLGPATNGETMTARQAQDAHIAQKSEDLGRLATNLDMIKVAGNFTVDKSGAVVDKIPGDYLFNVQTAIKEAQNQTFTGQKISPQSMQVLNNYAQRVGLPGFTGFSTLMGAIYKKVKANKDHPLGANARMVAQETVATFNDMGSVVKQDQNFLASLAGRSGFEDKIKLVNGLYVIANDPDGVLANMVANPQRWQNATQTSSQQITLNYADANKADYSPLANGFNLSTSAGTMVNGKFVPFSTEDVQTVRNVLGNAGKENYKEMFDANITMRSTRVNGEKVVQMIIPVKRGGKDNAIKAGGIGLSEGVESAIASGNSIVVNIPESRAGSVFNQSVYNINGNFVKAPNVKSMLLAQQQNFDDGFGNELLGLKNTGKANLPLHYDVHGIDGTVFVDQSTGRIGLSITKDGVTKTDYVGNMTVSELTPNSAETLSRNIRTYVDQIVQNGERKIADRRERVRSGANSSWKNADEFYNIED